MNTTKKLRTPSANSPNKLIKVVGVGSGGMRAVNRMYETGELTSASFLLFGGDRVILHESNLLPEEKINLDIEDLNWQTNPIACGEAYAQSKIALRQAFRDDQTKMVIIIAAMGKGFGSALSCMVANVAKEEGIFTLALVTTPFEFEGNRAKKRALEGLDELKHFTNALMIVDNERISHLCAPGQLFVDVDNVLFNVVKGLNNILVSSEQMEDNLSGIQTALSEKGLSMIGTGYTSSGANRLRVAFFAALRSTNFYGDCPTKTLSLHIYSPLGDAVRQEEYNEFLEFIHSQGWGTEFLSIKEHSVNRGSEFSVTVVASGYKRAEIRNYTFEIKNGSEGEAKETTNE